MSVDSLSWAEEHFYNTDTSYRAAVKDWLKERGLYLRRNRFWEPQGEMDLFTQHFSRLFKKRK